MTHYHLILASTSPRRREFIKILGLPVSLISPGAAAGDVDETPQLNERPDELVQRLSHLKAQAVAKHLPQLWPQFNLGPATDLVIIGSDTEVALDGQVLGKPASPAAAVTMLRALRGRPHEVLSGVTTLHLRQVEQAPQPTFTLGRSLTRLHRSQVWLRAFTEAELNAYVATGSPLDKAGAYGIQDPFQPVAHLDGCYASVMGLPLAELAACLAEIGLSLPPIFSLCSRHTGTTCCQTTSTAAPLC
ncbi:MAG TPA: nucleoside triphosphate pyrophosphatase [Anaerolineae bacterium]|nr:nucleoside triphosphate pyrophosphatase [Anaerolineae bacterium]HMR65300.1 nucleoside triphosphate pyrophosphatase [Anaerolineae bacterium]